VKIEDLKLPFTEDLFLEINKQLIDTKFTASQLSIRPENSKLITNTKYYGNYDELDLHILTVEHSGTEDTRVGVSLEIFKLMKKYSFQNALVAAHSKSSDSWRYSLVTSNLLISDKGKVTKEFSNPRRYSFVLGQNQKVLTPYKQLIQSGKVTDIKELSKRFSLEVVNNEFYREIAKLYDELVGTKKIARKLTYPSVGDESHEFAVRLIGRIIFCWFLREKKSKAGISLVPSSVLSRNASNTSNYYHSVLAPLFFEVLNKPAIKRTHKFQIGEYRNIPYLNGGLFSDDSSDHYKFDKDLELSAPGLVDVSDTWLHELFDLLERFNFTVDENTSYDTDLSIDPEMLGRVFENLLARINPETGETVRKSTGSFYTPREIVEYMVDASLSEYLVSKTSVSREKVEALVSYDLFDDLENELNKEENTSILEALSTLTVLDPACGSGAFPIGMLQKIVFIITKLDPNAEWWLAKQLEGAGPELRREFANRSVDYIRKLGIIRQTIFGVDIQITATEISRLRCFLTLIVDEAIDDSQENRGIRPLPNLDFKFVTANSLVALGNKSDQNIQLFEDFSSLDELRDVMNEYFAAPSTERDSIKYRFTQVQKKIFEKMLSYKEVSTNTSTFKISSWDPFEHKPSNWFDPEWMFGVKAGFDIIIGNPPWEKFKPLDPEFFEGYFSNYRELSKDEQKIKKAELLRDPIINERYSKYLKHYKDRGDYFKKAYSLQGSGDLNLYKLFLERSYDIAQIVALLIPGQITVDKGGKSFRERFYDDGSLVNVVGLSNKDGLFPAIDNNQKFVVILLNKESKNTQIGCIGWISDFREFDRSKLVKVDKKFFENFDENKTIFLDTGKSLEIIKKITSNDNNLSLSSLNYHYWGEYHVTNDASYFNDKEGKYILFSGKAIDQYDCMSKTWLDKHGRSSLWKKEGFPKSSGYRTEYFVDNIPSRIVANHGKHASDFRIVTQTVTGAVNNIRTLYSAILPKKHLTNNSLGNLFIGKSDKELVFYSTILNSFVIDWQARLKVATNLNKFILDTLVVPDYHKVPNTVSDELITLSLSLLAVSGDFNSLTQRFVGKNYTEILVTDEFKRQEIKNKIDGMVSKLYGLDKTELEFILGTFPIVDASIKAGVLTSLKG
jgi:hypothetical protein